MKRWLAVLLMVAWVGPVAVAQLGGKQATVSALANRTGYEPGQDGVAAVVVEIKSGLHAQSHTPKDPNLVEFSVKPEAAEGVTFGEVVYPAGHDETYPDLGTINVYTGKVIFFVPFKVSDQAKAGPVTLKGKARYQICDDKSCFAPESKPWSIEVKVVEPRGVTQGANEEIFKDYKASPGVPGAVTSQPAQNSTLQAPAGSESGKPDWGIAVALGAAFIAGILFNIVPCVLPMLPIKVLGFAEIAEHDRKKTLLLASVFGAGIVTVFAVLALLILVFKKITWGEQFSNPIFAWGMVILLLVLSLWLFGILNFNLPAGAYAFTPRHDTFFGNYLWGILTAIFSTPCTGPLFPPLLIWAQGQPVGVGIPAMMMVGVGMAFPYVLLSAFPEAARKFPRVGPWAELFKQMLGFMLLGFTAFFAAGRFTTPSGQWWAAVPVAAMAAFYLMARTVQLTKEAKPVAISTILSVSIITASVLVAMQFASVVNWTPYSDANLDAGRKGGKIVLVKFTANWCLNCQYVEATVFHDPKAIAALQKYNVVTLKADLTKEDAPGWARLRELSSTGGIPLTAIYAPGMDKPLQISSVYTTETLVKALDQLGALKTADVR